MRTVIYEEQGDDIPGRFGCGETTKKAFCLCTKQTDLRVVDAQSEARLLLSKVPCALDLTEGNEEKDEYAWWFATFLQGS